ncbi:MAG: histidine--tRNA ligase [Candidatus Heimdallarchaeota archaeon]|nr:histidine--tRNA ligase [Candidatus Heimdallarchaeota archaeon]
MTKKQKQKNNKTQTKGQKTLEKNEDKQSSAEETETLTITRPAGFRDFFPEDLHKVHFILQTMRRISKEFGYVEYEAPTVELLKLYEIKSGEGLVGETFKVESRSGSELVLRPEMTPSLSRMLAEKQQSYTKPIRWFSLPKCYRDETLQRGRVKEFWQYNLDILGMDEVYADAEVITILAKVIQACGLNNKQFVVLINDREFMQQFIEGIGINDYLPILQTFDRKDKLLQERIKKELSGPFSENDAEAIAIKIRHAKEIDESIFEEIPKNAATEQIVQDFSKLRKMAIINELRGLGLTKKQAEQLFELSELIAQPKEFLDQARKIFPGNNIDKALNNLTELAGFLEGFGIYDCCLYDGSLARGLDYYTGIIFEAWSREGILSRAIAGGGRYADLVATLGGQPLTGTGFGFGETVLMELLEEFNVEYPSPEICDIYIAPIQLEDDPSPAIELSVHLRRAGLSTVLNLFDWRIKRHFENAEKMGVRWMIIIGKRDLAEDSVTLRNIITGDQQKIPLSEIVKTAVEKIEEE